MGLLSGENSTFNCFIESTEDDWETGREVLSGELINNATQKCNTKVAAKEWTKTDPKDAKTLALPTRLSKLEKNKTSVI